MDWLKEESGQGMVEYALILAFIALALVTAFGNLGTRLAEKYEEFVGAFS